MKHNESKLKKYLQNKRNNYQEQNIIMSLQRLSEE